MSTQAAQDRFFEHDHANLRWRMQGNGPAIVLLHGWALDLDYWDDLVQRLAARYTLLRFDRRGFGLSTGHPDVWRNVPDLAALMEAASMRRAMIVGMSQGARLALHFAAAWPARVHALVLDGAPALDAEPELPLEEFRRLHEREGLTALQAAIRQHPLMQLQNEDDTHRQLIDAMLARYQGLDLMASATQPDAPPAHRRDQTRRAIPPPPLPTLAMPALVLHGSLDSPGRHQSAEVLAATLPDASRVQLPGAGHLALLDDPAAYVAALDSFAKNLPPW